MKKLLGALVLIVTLILLCACNEKSVDEKIQQEVEYDKPVKPVVTERTIDISEGIGENGDSFESLCDLNGDGIDEKIAIDVVGSDDGAQALEVAVGERLTVLDFFDGSLVKVYSCDIDINDGVRDIAIITEEGSGDPRIRILTYNEELAPRLFSDRESNENCDSNWLGYATTYYFKVNDDDTITLEEQTNSTGMWSVHRNYKLNEEGVFEEIPESMYAILPDFMANRDYFEGFDEEELTMWKKGYVKAHAPVSNGDITIEEGEYFKPVYDDDNNKLYIEKQNGEQGFIVLDYEVFENRHEVNNTFFFLAG